MRFFNSKRWGLTTLITSVIIAGLLLIPAISQPVTVGAITHIQGVVRYLNDLLDVNVSAPVDGYIIYWNNTTGYWEARAEDTFDCSDLETCSLDDMGDVYAPAPGDQYFLYWDAGSSNWTSRIIVDGDIPAGIARDSEVTTAVANEATARDAAIAAINLSDLHNVNATSPTDNQSLTWDNATSMWIPETITGGGGGTKIEDGDSDTKVDVEEGADEDMVRMDVGGTQAFVLDSAGIRSLPQQAASLGYRNGNVDILSSTLTKIILNAESYDVQNEFDTTNGTYTASTSGSYLVVAKLRYTTSLVATKRYMNYIYRNGVQLVTTGLCFAGGDAIYVQNVAIVSLSADDYLELWTWQNSGAQANIRGLVGHTEMAIYKLG